MPPIFSVVEQSGQVTHFLFPRGVRQLRESIFVEPHPARGFFPRGVDLMMVDTSVRFISSDGNEDTWKSMSTPKGGETDLESL